MIEDKDLNLDVIAVVFAICGSTLRAAVADDHGGVNLARPVLTYLRYH